MVFMAVPPKNFCISIQAISFHHSPWIIKNQKKTGLKRIFYDAGDFQSIMKCGGWFPRDPGAEGGIQAAQRLYPYLLRLHEKWRRFHRIFY